MRKFIFTAKNEIKPVGEVLEYIHNKCNKTITTNVKEAIAEKIIKENKIFEKICMLLGHEYNGYKKVTAKALQKAGVDYIIWIDEDKQINIDIKTGIGMDYTHGISIEITQNGYFTNRKDKQTDFDLYFLYDAYGIRIYLIPYKKIHDISWDVHTKKDTSFQKHTSFNGSGQYIMYPPEDISTIGFLLKDKGE
jgi:hypothetical protein